jgi:Lrp/AsnC family leucine-responsive transcriptional regulator
LVNLDEVDAKILRLLLEDSRMKKVYIAKECELSSTAIINRIGLMKKSGLLLKPVLSINMAPFGYSYPVTIGVNLHPSVEQDITELIEDRTIVAGIDKTYGEYDICLFVFAKNLQDLERLKNLIMNYNGVSKIDIHIWNEFNLNYSNINFHAKES